MAITVRELPINEWDRLLELPYGSLALPAPDVMVLVAEDEGDIVGVWSAGPIMMLEGLWVREDHRKTTKTLWKLLNGMVGRLKAFQVPFAYSIVQTTSVLRLAEHAGFKPVEGQFIMLNLKDA